MIKIIGKVINEYKINFIEYKDNTIKLEITCQKCGNTLSKVIKENRLGRLYCDKCNNKKVIIFEYFGNGNMELKIISVYQYNKLVKQFNNENDKEIDRITFIKNNLIKRNKIDLGIKDKVIDSKEIEKENKYRTKVNNKYVIDNNKITFRKIKKENEIKEDTIDKEINTKNILDRLMENEMDNFITWCKNNGELGKLVIKLYSKRKNTKKLNELTINDKEEYWFNRGVLKGYFKNSPYNIVNTMKIRDKLPNRYSYNKLFIYNFFKLIYETELNKSLDNENIDISIKKYNMDIIYIGTTYNSNRNIEKIMRLNNDRDIETIVIEGTHLKDNIELINNMITFNGNNKRKDINEILYSVCKLVLKQIDQRSYIVPDIEDIIEKMNLIY